MSHSGMPYERRCRVSGLPLAMALLACASGCGESPPGPTAGAGVAGASGTAVGGAAAGGALTAAGATGQVSGGSGQGGSGGAGSVAGGTSVGGSAGPPAGLVPVFVAQGHHGRISVSCDDGRSYPFNVSQSDDYLCFSDQPHDCDHSAFAGRGLAYGDGALVATWGWGPPGALKRSTDATTWATVMPTAPNFADVAYGKGKFVAGGNPTKVSKDGVTWENGGDLSFDFNYRGIEFVPTAGGTFVVTGESTDQLAISYSQDGVTWQAPSERPSLCGQGLRGVAGSDEVILIASSQGDVCTSTDAGQTWQYRDVTESFSSPPVWTGLEFWIYAGAKLWRSSTGESWTSSSIQPGNIAVGALARSPDGTWVAANDGWQVWYEKQQLFRSTDGMTWEVLDKSKFTGSHPINFISFGYAMPGAACGEP